MGTLGKLLWFDVQANTDDTSAQPMAMFGSEIPLPLLIQQVLYYIAKEQSEIDVKWNNLASCLSIRFVKRNGLASCLCTKDVRWNGLASSMLEYK
jgi:hypothetical protein